MSSSVQQLGYLGFGVSDLPAWENFMTQVLGLGLADRADDGSMRFRMDGHAYRFIIEPGAEDDMVFMGWEVADEAGLAELEAKLVAAEMSPRRATPEELADRRVKAMVKFTDPGGVPVELVVGPEMGEEPFVSEVVKTNFVADEMGLGHLVVSTRQRDESRDFYIDVLGFKLSDHISCVLGGHYQVDIAFLHANPRHHSLAMGGKMPKRIDHFLLEVAHMDDVGLALDRCYKNKVMVDQTLGRHPNDKMFSFYAHTPSGFRFEFGWGGRLIDDATWEPTTYDCISEWGHRRVSRPKPKKAGA